MRLATVRALMRLSRVLDRLALRIAEAGIGRDFDPELSATIDGLLIRLEGRA